MPSPTERVNKKPEYQKGQGADALPQGGATVLNQLVAPPKGISPRTEEPVGNLTGHDDIVFGPTDYPEEPMTAGAPFGAGPAALRADIVDDDLLVRRALTAASESPHATSEVKSFAARVLRGE